MTDISLKAYAKINLSLDILGLREDGFHQVDTIMHRIDLHDEVRVRWFPKKASKDLKILIKTSLPFIPNDQGNVAYQAVKAMEGFAPSGGQVRIDILKNIPTGAGLGGGSADGAAVIEALDRIWQLKLNLEDLLELAARIGSDTAFGLMMIKGVSCVRAGGRGEEIEILQRAEPGGWSASPMTDYLAILVKPKTSISTKRAYDLLDLHVKAGGLIDKPDNDIVEEVLRTAGEINFKPAFANAFEEVIFKDKEEIAVVKRDLERKLKSARLVQMSGSGSTVFAILKKEELEKENLKFLADFQQEGFFVKKVNFI